MGRHSGLLIPALCYALRLLCQYNCTMPLKCSQMYKNPSCEHSYRCLNQMHLCGAQLQTDSCGTHCQENKTHLVQCSIDVEESEKYNPIIGAAQKWKKSASGKIKSPNVRGRIVLQVLLVCTTYAHCHDSCWLAGKYH